MDFSVIPIELFLFLVAIIAGFIDTLAGGGGLITLPALLISGVPPLAALGTNKLQGSVGTATSSYMMLTKKMIQWHDIKFLMLASLIGSMLGAILVQFIDVHFLSFIIPVVLFAILVYFVFSPRTHEEDHPAKISTARYQYGVVPAIGCYDGMFGPGTGSFFATAAASLRGQGFIKATARAKALNFASNIASLVVFILAGQVVWLVGLVMIAGQVIGAWLGSHCLIRIQPVFLRYLVVTICLAMIFKYLFV